MTLHVDITTMDARYLLALLRSQKPLPTHMVGFCNELSELLMEYEDALREKLYDECVGGDSDE